MFFSNLQLYRLTQDLPFDADALETALATKPARACASQEMNTYGFTAPFGKGEDAPLVHVNGDFLLIATRKEERILPGSVVRDAVKEKVDEIEAEQVRKVYKRERDQIKDEIIQAFLPRAFLRRSATFAAIDAKRGLIIVNSASPKTSEDLLSTLREVIGSLPVRPVTVKTAPTAVLTDWLKTKTTAADFFVLDACELRDTCEDGGIVRCKQQDLTGDEVDIHLSTGKIVTKLAIAWQDKLSFTLDDRLAVRGLKFQDLLKDQAAADGGEEALGQLDASFALMMLTFREFLPALLEAFGGEEVFGNADALGQPATPTSSDGDALYCEAVAFVLESRRASISAVQRKLKIGYNRAARMIEDMQDHGIISAMKSDGSRQVLGSAA